LCVRWSTPRTAAGEVSPAHYLVQQCQQCVSIVSMHVNNASALHSCITHSATLRVLGVLRGGLAHPVCRVAHPAHYLMQQCPQCVSIVSMHVNNASALRACITYSAPLRALEVLQGGLARPVCRVALRALGVLQGGLARPACRVAHPCSPRLQGSHPPHSLALVAEHRGAPRQHLPCLCDNAGTCLPGRCHRRLHRGAVTVTSPYW
jgi:hypothetical protein